MAMLGVMSSGASYGYDLKLAYDRLFGTTKPIAFGQVYATLARMLRDGLISALGEQAGAGPDRKQYRVTPAGRERLKQWMFTPDSTSASAQSDLFAKTVIALLVDGDAPALLDIQRAELMRQMRELTVRKRSADMLHTLLYDQRLFHLEADLRWIDTASARIEQLRGEVVGR